LQAAVPRWARRNCPMGNDDASKGSAQENIKYLTAALAYNQLSNIEAFGVFDVRSVQLISKDDFSQVTSELLGAQLTNSEILDLHDMLDRNKDGFIDYQEWSDALAQADGVAELRNLGLAAGIETETAAPPVGVAVGVAGAASSEALLSAALAYNNLNLTEAFEAFDQSENKTHISRPDFISMVRTLLTNQLSDAGAEDLFSKMDYKGDGVVDMEEWTACLGKASEEGKQVHMSLTRGSVSSSCNSTSPPSRRENETKLWHHACALLLAVLKFNELSYVDGFTAFNTSQNAAGISAEDFETVACSLLERQMSRQHIVDLFRYIDSDKDGFLSQSEWIAALTFAEGFEVAEAATALDSSRTDSEPPRSVERKFGNQDDINSGKRNYRDLDDATVLSENSQPTHQSGLVSRRNQPASGVPGSTTQVAVANELTEVARRLDMALPNPVQEAKALLLEALEYNELDLDGGYEALDQQESGAVPYEEFSDLLAQLLGTRLSAEDGLALFHHIDVDNDGKLSLEEWKKQLAAPPAKVAAPDSTSSLPASELLSQVLSVPPPDPPQPKKRGKWKARYKEAALLLDEKDREILRLQKEAETLKAWLRSFKVAAGQVIREKDMAISALERER